MLATTIHESNTTPHHQAGQQHTNPDSRPSPPDHSGDDTTSGFPHSGRRGDGPVVSGPNSVFDDFLHDPTQTGPLGSRRSLHVHQNRTHYRRRSISRFVRVTVIRKMRAGPKHVVLLRKEVIQPHLPVRLPCYDFVPIADPTFDGSLPRGVRPPASGVTDFHDVTGGVYKARERIHRSVADLRLLATPTSRGRVADPDPN